MMINSVILVLMFLATLTKSLPVTVPTYNNYNYQYSNSYNNDKYTNSNNQEITDRKPNSYFNRLTNNLPSDNNNNNNNNNNNQNDDYDDYEDQQTDKPVLSEHLQQANPGNQGNPGYYNNFNNLYNYWFGDQRIKHRFKRRKGSQPCIPIALSNNRYKRDISDSNNSQDDGKTLSLILGDYNFNGGGGYYGPQPGYQGIGPSLDNTNPQNDRPGYGLSSLVYQPYGGYPCVPVNFGHKPHRPFFGGGGGGGGYPSGGPLGFFGQGGLLDFGGGARPPIIHQNQPLRPPYGLVASSDYMGSASNQNSVWGTVVDKFQEFISGIEPNKVIGAFSDALSGIGTQIMNLGAQPANVLREFGTLF